MKKYGLLLLLSVLLCMTVSLSACGDGETPTAAGTTLSTQAPTEAPTEAELEPIENPENDDFITYEYEENEIAYEEIHNLTELYGKPITTEAGIFVFRKITKNFENIVTETYTFYSAKDNAVFKTHAISYEDGNYGATDDFGNQKKKPVEVTVDIGLLASDRIPYIKIKTVTRTRIADEIIEENALANSYIENYVVTYLDVKGTEITSTSIDAAPCTLGWGRGDGKKVALAFGDVACLMDVESGAMISSWNPMTDTPLYDCDYENDAYKYYCNVRYWSVNALANSAKVQVFNKNDVLVTEYLYPEDALFNNAYVLQNGDVLTQSLIVLDQKTKDYDVLWSGGIKVDIQTVLIDVSENDAKAVDLSYLLSAHYTREDLLKMEAEGNPTGAHVTENALNVFLATPFDKAGADQNATQKVLFFDNKMQLLHIYNELHPEQDVNELLNMRVLPTGDYLVKLGSGVGQMAVVKSDGKLRARLPEGATVFYDKIVFEGRVYDLDLQELYDIRDGFEEDDDRISTFEGVVGHYLIAASMDTDLVENTPGVYDTVVTNDIKIFNLKGAFFTCVKTFNDCQIVQITENYIVLNDMGKGLYTLYNAKLDALYTSSEPIIVEEYDNACIIETYYQGELIYFALTAKMPNDTEESTGGVE